MLVTTSGNNKKQGSYSDFSCPQLLLIGDKVPAPDMIVVGATDMNGRRAWFSEHFAGDDKFYNIDSSCPRRSNRCAKTQWRLHNRQRNLLCLPQGGRTAGGIPPWARVKFAGRFVAIGNGEGVGPASSEGTYRRCSGCRIFKCLSGRGNRAIRLEWSSLD